MGWAAAIGSTQERNTAFVEFTKLLTNRRFKDGDVELVAVHSTQESCKFAQRINGIYHRKMGAEIENRACYQRLLHAPEAVLGVCCDDVYIFYGEKQGTQCWQIRFGFGDRSLIAAYCAADDMELTTVKGPWEVQQDGANDFAPDDALTISAMIVD